MKAFYNGLREVYGPQNRGIDQLLEQNGKTVLKARNDTLKRFAQYFDLLLNVPGEVDQEALNSLKNMPPYLSLDDKPSFDELLDAIDATKENKALGEWGVPVEM